MKVGSYDIECADWSRFLCGAFVDAKGRRYLSWDETDFFDRLLAAEGPLYAHAGGGYDALWAVEQCARRGIRYSATPRGSGLLSVKIDGAPELRDSLALWPDRLAICARVTSSPKLDLALPCECGAECGGYCALSRPLSDAERGRVSDYLMADADACRAVVGAIRERDVADEIAYADTIGSTAWRTAAAWLGLPRCEHTLARYAAIRRGYYGGRVEVYRPRARWGWRYDIHSSYPAALTRVALPVGAPRRLRGLAATLAYVAGRPGIYSATVHVPECHVPPLPMRAPGRLYYPHGTFSGEWTAIELQHAESCGARILAIDAGYVWERAEKILAPFAERVWAMREKAISEGSEWARRYKWIANSVTGKTAQRPGFGSYRYLPHPVAPEVLAEARTFGGPPPIVTSRGVHLEIRTMRLSPCAHVEWAAYLTAEARIELHRQLLEAGDGLIYCDTDSCYSVEEISRRIGPGLGEWGCEGFMAEWEANAPKAYRYRSGEKWRACSKGMPGLTAAGFDSLMRGEAWVHDRGVNRYRSARRSGDMFRRRSLSRRFGGEEGWCGGRLWDGIAETTRAPHVDDIATRCHRRK